MFRIDGIQCFLDDVDPKIFARGLDYYESGNVEHIWNSWSRRAWKKPPGGADSRRNCC